MGNIAIGLTNRFQRLSDGKQDGTPLTHAEMCRVVSVPSEVTLYECMTEDITPMIYIIYIQETHFLLVHFCSGKCISSASMECAKCF